jgi:hypothetical protein
MPAKFLISLAKKAGMSVEDAEKAWEKGKAMAKHNTKEGTTPFWKQTTAHTEELMGLRDRKKKKDK